MVQHIKFVKLCNFLIVFGVILSLSVAQPFENESVNDTDSLVLVHVIFRHGDRTPTKSGLWKSNPYYNESFYDPYGYGQLTNEGKRREYNLGRALRTRYREFLNDTWNVKLYDAWSTNYNRTKMSLALVLAGLFPAEGSVQWQDDLLWQPAPYNYLPVSEDLVLSSWACPTVLPLIYNTEEVVKRLKEYDGLIETLSNGTGEDVDYISALDLYFGMYIQEELGFTLPSWTQAIYPEPFKTYTVDFYYIETSTEALKKVITGYLIEKILKDTQNKINGTLDPQERKIFLYSGHELTVAAVLTALDLFKLVDPPPYGSSLIVEVHYINGVYGIKMFYRENENDEPYKLTLPGCEEFCPFDKFTQLTSSVVPKSDAECYGERH